MTAVLVLRPISAGQARYYLEGPAPGRWTGAGSDDLGLRGAVEPASLHAVLGGHHPGGDQLLARIPSVRRAGFDLIFATPKSVSLLAALGDEDQRARLAGAHEQAVTSALGYLQTEATWTRRSSTQLPTTGLVAAGFGHAVSAAGDPHLHTHVVVANLVHGEDDRWSTLDSRALYRHARAASAVFQATLRHHIAEQGLRFDWTVNRHGQGDVVGVSRAAIDAASLRQVRVTQEIDSGLAGRVGRATAAGRTRTAPDPGPHKAWSERVAAAGLDQAAAQRLFAGAVAAKHRSLDSHAHRAAPDNASITRLLTEQHSRFRRPDVVRAVATLSTIGAPAATMQAAADGFLTTALPAGDNRWTTAGLRRLEERIVAAATPGRSAVGVVAEGAAIPEGMTDAGRQAVARLTRGGAPVDLLRGDLISQAQVLDAARGAWEAGGHRVALVSRSERGQARWRTLAALDRPPPSPSHATVVVVDNAERWSTHDLHHVVADAAARQAKVVLLDGGTSPRQRRAESPATETLRAMLPAIEVGPASELDHRVPRAVVHGGRDQSVTLAPTGEQAIGALVDDWRRRSLAGERPRIVALGPEEAEHLNAEARSIRVEAGELKGPSLEIKGKTFQAGDEVAALKRDARLGSVPGGTVGQVTAIDVEQHTATIQWAGRTDPDTVTTTGNHKQSLPLTYGYATTPPYLRQGHDGVVLSLGHVEAVAPGVRPDRVYDVVPTPDRARDRLNPITALLDELPGHRRDDRSPRAVTPDAARPLSDLAAERDRLGEHLRTTAPPDVRPELRRLTEERDWLVAVPDRLRRPDHAAALGAVEGRRATLTAANGDRADWLDQHRDQLERWADLSADVAWREAALGRGAEVRPTLAVSATLGPPPSDPVRGPAWRRAAEAIESHRERWELPDRPLDIAQSASRQPDLPRRAGELRVLAAAGELQRTRGADRGLAPTGL